MIDMNSRILRIKFSWTTIAFCDIFVFCDF